MSRFGDIIGAGVRGARLARGLVRVMKAEDEEARARARAHLAAFMGEERGLAAKIGQLLAGRDQGESYEACCEGLEALPEEAFLAALEEAWGRPWDQVIARLEGEGIAASIGQVRRAVLNDGRVVAIKLRHPGIDRSLEAEIRLLGLVPGIGPARRWGLDLDGLKRVLGERLRAELDYLGEAGRQEDYRRGLGDEDLVVAAVHLDLCRDNVLVQDWEEGIGLREAAARFSPEQRRSCGRILLRHFFRRLFVAGSVHADPHDGNLRFRLDGGRPRVLLYDFGALAPYDPRAALGFLRLILALRDRSRDSAEACLVAAGFAADKLAKLDRSLVELARILVEPFTLDQPIDLASWRPGERLRALLGEESWWFRSAGPPEFLPVMRALDGLVRQLQTLGARLDWFAELSATLPDELAAAADMRLPSLPRATSFRALARRLRVLVTEDDRELVSVAMPIRVLESLSAVMDDDLVERLRARDLDPDRLALEARQRGCPPGVLFEDDDGARRVVVALE